VALGDKSIRIWDISEATSREADDSEEGGSSSSKNPYRTILLWKGLQAKVTCVRTSRVCSLARSLARLAFTLMLATTDHTQVAWHPASSGVLAYGMDDGRVGVYNTHAQTVAQFAGHHARG
jgi:hypothetical protein